MFVYFSSVSCTCTIGPQFGGYAWSWPKYLSSGLRIQENDSNITRTQENKIKKPLA
jgi:hypothetical protein